MEKNLEISLNKHESKNENQKKENNLLLTPSTRKITNFHLSQRGSLKSHFNGKNLKLNKNMTKEERKRFQIIEREKQKNDKFLSKSRYWRKLDFDKKYINLIQKPQTPHNTGQYITHMFNSKKQKNIFDFEDIDEIAQCCNIQNKINEENNNDDNMELDLDEALGLENVVHKRNRYMSCEYNFEQIKNKLNLEKKQSDDIIYNNNNDNDNNNFDNNDLNMKKFNSAIYEL